MYATYTPGVFSVENIDQAMSIILTPEDVSTPYRWETETPYIVRLIQEAMVLTKDSILLDYGCGIGRLSKALIDSSGCRVIGVDISASMRALAASYVGSPRFFACSPEMLDVLADQGFQCSSAISIWVLQHCAVPGEDIGRIQRVLKTGGDVFVINNQIRAVPTDHGWVNDGIDIQELLRERFTWRSDGQLAEEFTSKSISEFSFWMSLSSSKL